MDIKASEAAEMARKDLRKSHFNLGTAPQITESSAKMAFKELDILNNGVADTSSIRDRMQKGYFRIGDDKNRNVIGDTTYKTGISADKGACGL